MDYGEINYDNSFNIKLESDKNNLYSITFNSRVDYLEITAKQIEGFIKKGFFNKYTYKEIKQNKFDSLCELINGIKEKIKSNDLTIIEHEYTLILNIPTKDIEIIFELRLINKNNNEKINELTEILIQQNKELLNLKNEFINYKNNEPQLKNETNQLKNEINSLKNNEVKLQDEIKLLKNNESLFQNDIKQLKSEKSDLKTEIIQLKNENTQLKNKLNDLESNESQLKIDINQLKNEMTEMKNENAEMKNKITNLKNNKSQLQNEIKQLEEKFKNDISNLKNNESKLNNEINQFKNEITKIKNEYTPFKNEVNQLKNDINYLKNADAQTKNDVSEIRNDVRDLKNSEEQLNNEIIISKIENNNLKEKLNILWKKREYSKIINGNQYYYDCLKKLINPFANINFEILYRLTDDGSDKLTFHELCDNKGSTITLFHINDGNIVGIYTPLSWDSSETWKNDMETFIFNLKNNKKYKKIIPEKSICCKKAYGPWTADFGCGSTNYSLNSIRYHAFDIYKYYEKGNEILFSNNHSSDYDVLEVEIYKVIID